MNVVAFAVLLASFAVIIGVNVLVFGRRRRTLGPAAIEAAIAAQVPDFRCGPIVLAVDGGGALAQSSVDGAIYLVAVLGRGFVTRRLRKELLRAVRRDGARLTIWLADFAFPRARLLLANERLAREWQERMRRGERE